METLSRHIAFWCISLLSCIGWNAPRHACAAETIIYPVGDEANLSSIYSSDAATAGAETTAAKPIELKLGPQLFVDDFLIAASDGVTRRVNSPQRDAAIANPIITSGEDFRCVGPYLTVLRDADAKQFRLWYHGFSEGDTGSYAVAESKDGIHWDRPARPLKDPGPTKWGCSIVDDGEHTANPAQRYKLAWYAWSKTKPKVEGKRVGGLMLATSANGIDWKLFAREPMVCHNHDINSLYFDPIRKHYVYTFSTHREHPTWTGSRRITMQSSSTDLKNWSQPWYVLVPNPKIDQGEAQFYAMDGYLARGDLLIGMVKVLRDDLRAAETPEGAFGIGYTTLAWTRDGRHWVRDAAPFFEPDPKPGAWDHAHAWIDEQVLVDDELRLYYGGYKNGHKMGRTTDRQIGLVTLRRDRYVGRVAGANGGTLRTVPVALGGDKLTVNAEVKGSLEVRLLDPAGKALPGFDYVDFQPVRGDSLDHRLQWKESLKSVQNRPVQIEFRMKEATLFGLAVFGLAGAATSQP
jgi:hypothetical protein